MPGLLSQVVPLPPVTIDGVPLDMEEFARLLATFEGFEFELRFKDKLED